MKCRRCHLEKDKSEFTYVKKARRRERTCKQCRKEMASNSKKGIANKMIKSEIYIKIESFFISKTGEHTIKEVCIATGVEGAASVSNVVRRMIDQNMINKSQNKRPITYSYISDKALHINTERKKREEISGCQKRSYVDTSDFNPELEMDRRLTRWIEEGMSEREMIVKIGDHRAWQSY